MWDTFDGTGSDNFEGNMRAMRDNAQRRQDLESACRYASRESWEAQWSDLWGFYRWAESLTGSPPWADDEPPPPDDEQV